LARLATAAPFARHINLTHAVQKTYCCAKNRSGRALRRNLAKSDPAAKSLSGRL
jgi:hypothetical protein